MTTSDALKSLPVPPLAQTLDRYVAAVRPLSTDAEFAETKAAVAAFADGDGPECQRLLQEFAAQRDAAGSSWLAGAWLTDYLAVRDSLPLISNVGWLVNWPGYATGLDLTADFLHRIANIHLAYLRGELPGEVTGRGDPVDPAQRAFLAGGTRLPRGDVDGIANPPVSAQDRETVVLWRGAAYAVPISDDSGLPRSRPVLAEALSQVIAQDATVEDFAPLSYLGSGALVDLLPQVLAAGDNESTYQRLVDALFVVNLTDRGEDADDFLTRVTFGIGQAWVYKTMSYQVDLATGRVATHMEHSTVDGATLKDVIARAQQVAPDDSPGASVTVDRLGWTIPAEVSGAVVGLIADYEARASQFRVRTVGVDIPVPDLPFRVSSDAMAQWLMLYAQLITFGRIRSTYEAVDMREYRAGRTECLRPNDAAAVALVEALQRGDATGAKVESALAAHKEWVKRCKTGQAIDRHLYGLQNVAERAGLDATLQREAGYARLTTDFLSTSSLGDQDQLVRFAFAPTSIGGLGISYSATGSSLEFCISYREDEHGETIDGFVAALEEGGRRLRAVLDDVAASSSASASASVPR